MITLTPIGGCTVPCTSWANCSKPLQQAQEHRPTLALSHATLVVLGFEPRIFMYNIVQPHPREPTSQRGLGLRYWGLRLNYQPLPLKPVSPTPRPQTKPSKHLKPPQTPTCNRNSLTHPPVPINPNPKPLTLNPKP